MGIIDEGWDMETKGIKMQEVRLALVARFLRGS